MSTDEKTTHKTIESKPKMASRFSSLPEIARQDSVVQNHTDKLGNVDMGGVAKEAALTRKNYKILFKAFIVAVLLVFLLVLSTFGVSFAAAILAKDTQVSSSSGALMVKNGSGDSKVVKTQEALKDVVISDIPGLSFEELRAMKKFVLAGDGDDTGVQLDVKGVSKSADGLVTLVVEGGGTIVYDSEGIFDATGIAKTLLASVLQVDSPDIADGDGFRRALYGIFGAAEAGTGSGWYEWMSILSDEYLGLRQTSNADPEHEGIFYYDCCIPGYNDLGIHDVLEEGERAHYVTAWDECSDLCMATDGCQTADTWRGKCYLQSVAATRYAKVYPGCTMFVKYGSGVPEQCIP